MMDPHRWVHLAIRFFAFAVSVFFTVLLSIILGFPALIYPLALVVRAVRRRHRRRLT